MEDKHDQSPLELRPDFIESLEVAALKDDEGTLRCISHEELVAIMDRKFDSIEKSRKKFEAENPDYTSVSSPRLD